jgi:hypothetical protein
MSGKIKLLIFFGIFITAFPILNFPRSVKTILLFVIGIATILLTLSIKRGIRKLKLKIKHIEGQQGVMMQ